MSPVADRAYGPPTSEALPRLAEERRATRSSKTPLNCLRLRWPHAAPNLVTATSASEALRAVAAQAPDVVVTDIAMPGADGYWLVREIRQLEDARARTVPVLAVTAFGREHFRGLVLAAGFVDHLEKPVDPEVLCLAVARARGR